jgi:hypothetical protein
MACSRRRILSARHRVFSTMSDKGGSSGISTRRHISVRSLLSGISREPLAAKVPEIERCQNASWSSIPRFHWSAGDRKRERSCIRPKRERRFSEFPTLVRAVRSTR